MPNAEDRAWRAPTNGRVLGQHRAAPILGSLSTADAAYNAPGLDVVETQHRAGEPACTFPDLAHQPWQPNCQRPVDATDSQSIRWATLAMATA